MMRYNDDADFVTFTSIWIGSSNEEDANFGGSRNEVTGEIKNGMEARTEMKVEEEDIVGTVLVGVVLSAVVLCTVVGNVMVLLAVFVNSHLRSTTNYFIVNLAIADLLLGTTVLPFSASLEVFKKWLFGQVFCDMWAAIDVLCCTASIFSLCVISIDRYIGVTRPLQRSSIMTERRAVYVILLIWLLALAISVAPLVGWRQPASEDPQVCTVTTQTGYVLFSASASFYIPLSIILMVYFRIYREAMKYSRFLSTGVKTTKVDESGIILRVHKGGSPKINYGLTSTPPARCPTHVSMSEKRSVAARPTGPCGPSGHQSSSSSERSENSVRQMMPSRLTAAGKVARFKRETKAAKTLGIVVGVFILCWFPFFFILPLGALCPPCNIPPLLFTVFFWLGYCNSLMNPVIYACSSREFQFAFRRILRCKFRRRPRLFLNDQESSSCHEFNHANNSSRRRLRAQANKSGSWNKKAKNRGEKLTHSPAIPLRGFNVASSSIDLQDLAESPTQSVSELQQKLEEELNTSDNSLMMTGTCEWSCSTNQGLWRNSKGQDEDMFQGFSSESAYPQCGRR